MLKNRKWVEKILTTGGFILKHLHPTDAKERAHLYIVNAQTIEQFVENLSILLESDSEVTESDDVFVFPFTTRNIRKNNKRKE